MEWANILSGIINILFQVLASIVSVILAPLDLLVNALVPQATDKVSEFFGWAIAMLQYLMDFFHWFLYVLGISSQTWSIMISCLVALVLLTIVSLPIKLVFSAMRGLKS